MSAERKTTAGPSTPQIAKGAFCSAQDDSALGIRPIAIPTQSRYEAARLDGAPKVGGGTARELMA